MADSKSQTTPAGNSAFSPVARALEALKTYDRGSARSALLPLDEAVGAALKDAKRRAEAEQQLIGALQAGGSSVAREYLCARLALAGSGAAVPALAPLLAEQELSTAARNALQAIPGTAAVKALRASLPKAQGTLKVGIINSLGARRDPAAVGVLKDCLRDHDEQVAAAAAAALGEIGTVRASRALRGHFLQTQEVLRRELADPMLVCAGRLSQEGRKTEAGSLLKLLLSPGLPAYVQKAAERALPG